MKDTFHYEDLCIIYSACLIKVNCFIIRQDGRLFEILILTSVIFQGYHFLCLPLIFCVMLIIVQFFKILLMPVLGFIV